jgi:hypothetical protein
MKVKEGLLLITYTNLYLDVVFAMVAPAAEAVTSIVSDPPFNAISRQVIYVLCQQRVSLEHIRNKMV